MAYWIFKCNPTFYRLEDRLVDPCPKITWLASRYRDEIGPGDTVFVWITGKDRGVRAVMTINGAPCKMAEIESEQKYAAERDTEIRFRVVATLTHRNVNLSHVDLRKQPGLKDLSVFHGCQRGTNFLVTPSQGAVLMRMIHGDRI